MYTQIKQVFSVNRLCINRVMVLCLLKANTWEEVLFMGHDVAR